MAVRYHAAPGADSLHILEDGKQAEEPGSLLLTGATPALSSATRSRGWQRARVLLGALRRPGKT